MCGAILRPNSDGKWFVNYYDGYIEVGGDKEKKYTFIAVVIWCISYEWFCDTGLALFGDLRFFRRWQERIMTCLWLVKELEFFKNILITIYKRGLSTLIFLQRTVKSSKFCVFWNSEFNLIWIKSCFFHSNGDIFIEFKMFVNKVEWNNKNIIMKFKFLKASLRCNVHDLFSSSQCNTCKDSF